jgi:hypothetical protein
MFTNEIDQEESVTTIMDEEGQLEDFQIFIDDTGVFMRQFNEVTDTYDSICLSHDMFRDFNLALNQGEGMFKAE